MHIVVTGASSGIGEAIVRAFDEPGNQLTLVARREDLLNKLAGEIKCDTLVHPLDLSDLEHCTDFIKEAESKFGPIDVMINNAGIQRVAETIKIPIEDAEKLMRVNLSAPLRINHQLLPAMLKRKSGIIVNVASIASFNPTKYMYYYVASKAGLGMASEALNAEMKDTPVHIITVYPGPIATPMETRVKELYEDLSMADNVPTGSPEELAERVKKAVLNREDRVTFPDLYKLSRFLPTFSTWITNLFAPKPR